MGKMQKVIIIGSGIAGLTAAIYCARADLRPLVIEGNTPGGLLMLATNVENYPGYENGISGLELIDSVKEQAERFGTEFNSGTVNKINLTQRPFAVEVKGFSEEIEILSAESIIVATGNSPRLLGLEAEKDLIGYGISTCAFCDGAFFRGKTVAVVGGGNSAMQEAIFLTKFASKVYLIHRRDEFRAGRAEQKKVLENEKIELIMSSEIEDIFGDQISGVTGLKVKNKKTQLETNLKCEGLFYAIGYTPNTSLFKGVLALDEQGYIATGPQTNIPGVFAAGDVLSQKFRQAVIAAGSGCQAALEAEIFISKNQ